MSRKMYGFYIIIALMVIGSTNKWLTFAAMGLAALAAVRIALDNANEHDPVICKGIILLLLLQNLSIGIGAHTFHNTDLSLQFISQIPFMCITIIWITAYFTDGIHLEAPGIVFLIWVACFALSALNGIGSIGAVAITVRNMTVFFMAYSIGRKSITSHDDVGGMIRFLAWCGILVTIAGIILLIGGYDLYKMIGIHEVYIAKRSPFPPGEITQRFLTALFTGRGLMRMGSVYYEPINMGYFLACCLLCCLFGNSWASTPKRIAADVIIGTGLILTFGKGAYLLSAAAVFCVFADTVFFRRSTKKSSRIILILVMTAVVSVGMTIYMKFWGMAVWPHIWGIQGTLKTVRERPIGHGLGRGGNMAMVYGSNADALLSSGQETALMAIIYQTGIQGGIAFIASLATISSVQRLTGKTIEKLFFYIPYALLVVCVFQENTFTPQCVVPFMLMQGGVYSAALHADKGIECSKGDMS